MCTTSTKTQDFDEAKWCAFLSRFADHENSWIGNRLDAFRLDFSRLRGGMESVGILAAELDRHHAPDFNIFHVLGVATREVKTHSALLATLLDPAGVHGQGDLFLREFLAELRSRLEQMSAPASPQKLAATIKGLLEKKSLGRWIVRREVGHALPMLAASHPNAVGESNCNGASPDSANASEVSRDSSIPPKSEGFSREETPAEELRKGFLDIVLESPDKGILVVIENKIYAGDQDIQLQRYWAWLNLHRHAYPHRALIYLTVEEGRCPPNVAKGVEYVHLSYRPHIDAILTRTLPHIPATWLRETLTQYLKVVGSL